MDGELILIENENSVWVTWADDPDNWVVCFRKNAHFPARAWAERMLAINNLDLSPEPTLQIITGIRLENYHPDPSSL